MAQAHILVGAGASPANPTIRRIAPADLIDALAKGLKDFSEMPSHALFLCVIYPAIGILLAGMTLGFAIIPLLFPLAAGFALIGPFAALGLYELRRRREAGVPVSATNALDVVYSPRSRDRGARASADRDLPGLGRDRQRHLCVVFRLCAAASITQFSTTCCSRRPAGS